MPEIPSSLLLEIGVSGADDVELERLTTQLRDDLLQLDVDEVRRLRATDIPAGARSAGAAELGALMLTVLPTPAIVSGLVNKLRGWLARDPRRSVTVSMDGDKFELTNATSDDVDKLMAVWLGKHERTDRTTS